jgi:hypothetical protein
MKMHWSSFTALLLWATLSSSAHAHIKLLKPTSWLKEDDLGAPQKGGPCGPGGADDVQPMPLSNEVTTAHAGDTVMVEFQETVHHPGWFRISLAADTSEFEEIKFPNTADCTYDMATVPKEPHGNVLADGVGMDTALLGDNRTLTQMVKLPDAPCEKCTLQVIQVMADAAHSPPGCIYHHCAILKILPKAGAAAGSGGASAGAAAGSGGSAAGAGGSTGAGSAGAGATVVARPAGGAGAGGSSTTTAGAAGKAAPPVSSALGWQAQLRRVRERL